MSKNDYLVDELTGKPAKLVTKGRGGVTVYYTNNHRLETYGGQDLVEEAIKKGIPVVDSTTISNEQIVRWTRLTTNQRRHRRRRNRPSKSIQPKVSLCNNIRTFSTRLRRHNPQH